PGRIAKNCCAKLRIPPSAGIRGSWTFVADALDADEAEAATVIRIDQDHEREDHAGAERRHADERGKPAAPGLAVRTGSRQTHRRLCLQVRPESRPPRARAARRCQSWAARSSERQYLGSQA